MRKMKNDEYDKGPNERNPIMDDQVQSIALAFFQICISRPDGDFEFNILKTIIMLAPEQLALCKTEQQANRVLMYLTDATMGAVDDSISNMKELSNPSKREMEIIEEYDELWTELKSCKEGYISVLAHPEGSEAYEFKINTKNRRDDFKEATTVSSHLRDHRTSGEISSENLYRNLNCDARVIFRRAFRLAIRCKYINPNEMMSIKGVGIDAGKTKEYQKTMKLQLGGANGQ